MRDYGWPVYVPVAERRVKAQKQLEKMLKKGVKVQPVQIAGRKIAASFWGKGWCDHMESFSDYANRLPRGRTYVRNGSVCHLEINGGQISAMVSGTSLYKVSITIKPLPATKWEGVKRSCSGRVGSLIDLLRGRLDQGVMEVVTDREEGLFPRPGEIKFDCDCPDWAGMCKHVAAVLYGVGARLDDAPEMLFVLRGVDHAELVDVTAAITDVAQMGTSRRRIAATGIADVFGIELAASDSAAPEATAPVLPAARPAKPEKAAKTKSPLPDRLAVVRKLRNAAVTEKKMAVASNPRAEAIAVKKKTRKEPTPFPDPLTGNAIHAWRTALGETQAKFAARIDVSGATISQWEKKGDSAIGMMSSALRALRKAWQQTR